MNNKVFCKKLKELALLLICFVLFSSCANLPGKENNKDVVVQQVQESDQQPETETTTNNNVYIIPNTWVQPEGGPTVTPIVLNIEKRGEEGSLIIRPASEIEENNTDNSYTYSSNDYFVPTAISGNNTAVMQDKMELVSYNPVNGATVLPSQAIHLDVTLRNTGTTTWQTNYKVIDSSNVPMTVQKEYNLPYPVAPGGTVLLSIYMAAPKNQGTFTESFRIQDTYGVAFGNFDYVLTVGDFSYVTAIPTLTATITPTYYSPEGITATPDGLAWMCIDPERSKLQDCYSFCVEYSNREEFKYCYYNGERYLTPVP